MLKYRQPKSEELVPIEGAEGFIRSPGYEWVTGEDGKPHYVFNPNRKAQVFANKRVAKLLGPNIAKADAEEPKAE